MSITYTVQGGDTLTKIAKAHGVTVEDIAKANNIKNVDNILIGQQLSIGEVEAPKEESVSNPMRNDSIVGFDTFVKSNEQKEDNGSNLGLMVGTAGATLALSKGYEVAAPWLKAKGSQAVKGMKSAAETAQLRYMYGKDAAVKNGAAVKKFILQKGKHLGKSAELNYAFGKDAVKKSGQQLIHKGKVAGRLTRMVANNKVAPTLLNGVKKYIKPVALAYAACDIKNAYEQGGSKAAVKKGAELGTSFASGWMFAKIGAAVGSCVGPIGTVIGGTVGGVLGYCMGEELFKIFS